MIGWGKKQEPSITQHEYERKIISSETIYVNNNKFFSFLKKKKLASRGGNVTEIESLGQRFSLFHYKYLKAFNRCVR